MANKEFSTIDAVNEKSPAEYTCKFRDAGAGAAVLNAVSITAITATLKDVATGTVLNGRNAQSVLNVNGGVLDTDGTFTLTFAAADVAVQSGNQKPFEAHRLTLSVTYVGAASPLTHEVLFWVRNLVDVA